MQARALYDQGVRRFDPEQTPQRLEAAKVPTGLVFTLGTAFWLVLLILQGARHFSGHSVDGRFVLICAAGIALGAIGIGWARVHARRQKEKTS